ncbi:transposase [Methanohalophilus euhalobius]|jgi:hypothetical protein|uniref:Transposase IS4-like domain-containing protein n=1 Tax=Methanohalophilus euhalobius TaxID=51203 RepID=A0A285GB53_9EURY|nr:transposase [Methanohalophilus euhalobius]PQV41975.1 hypothetical protein B0H22_11212 [Methanohalophilus euhalobius]RNI10576.1 hypothetical protein EDD83_04265 [Methanohalophilus euhalobius]TCL11620.1 hypothetical protein C7960_0793 [Methanohalophilus euhalobius]SNY20553.1 hypothetical protein SAMN06295989_1119 [Methanohalophilus euhalobius]
MSSDYLNFIDTAMSVAGRSRLPIYSCKYSKRKYTQHQLLTLVLIKEYTGNDYRAEAIIPVRCRKRKKIKGKYRRKMRDEFDEDIYHYRNLVETMFSVLKRKYGEELKATKYRNQAKEVKFKLLIHNIDRATSISVIIQMRISTEPRNDC